MWAVSILAYAPWSARAANLDLLAGQQEEDAMWLLKSESFDVSVVTERDFSGLLQRQWWDAAEAVILARAGLLRDHRRGPSRLLPGADLPGALPRVSSRCWGLAGRPVLGQARAQAYTLLTEDPRSHERQSGFA